MTQANEPSDDRGRKKRTTEAREKRRVIPQGSPPNDGQVSQQAERSSALWRYASAARAGLTVAVSWTASHVVIFSTIIVIGIAFWDLFLTPLRIGKIEIIGQAPTTYPFNGETLAYAIRDRVNRVFERARIDNRIIHIEVGEPQPIKVDLPEQRFSVTQVKDFIRSVFHINSKEIIGTLVQVGNEDVSSPKPKKLQRYRLTLRKSDQTASPFDAQGPLDALIDGAATSLIEETEPAIAANYLRMLGPSMRVDAIAKAQRAVKLSLGSNHDASQKRQSLLILGYALGDAEEFVDSDKAFELAMEDGDAVQRARSYDGQAYVRIQAARDEQDTKRKLSLLEESKPFLTKALDAVRDYDSAMFHEAEIYAIRAVVELAEKGCQAKPFFEKAGTLFSNVTELYPDFAIAYYAEGVLSLELLNYLQNIHKKNCPSELRQQMKTVADRAGAVFEKALRYDIDSEATWLQWAILTFQRAQMESISNSKIMLLDLAIERYTRALRFPSVASYPVVRLSEAIVALKVGREEARNPMATADALPDEYLRSGVSAFCEAFPARDWADETERRNVGVNYRQWCGSASVQ